MGLLLGDVVDAGGTGKGQERLTARIWSVSLHRRETDVRSDDRVEISPEQLAAAAGEAERISEELGIHTRVVGWLPPPLPLPSCARRSFLQFPAVFCADRTVLRLASQVPFSSSPRGRAVAR